MSALTESFTNKAAKAFSAAILSAAIASTPAATANDANIHKTGFGNVQADYITECRSGNCAGTNAVGWSNEKENWNGVAISVRMGTQPLITDQQIKDFLSAGFEHFGVKNYKFFFEQNDMPATGVSFHVRGSTSEIFTLGDNIRPAVERYARQANNPNFVDVDEPKE